MPHFSARIDITPREGILDPAGGTVERSLPALGWDNVRDVRIGKSIHLTVEATDPATARDQVDEMCRRLLANPVIEDYAIALDTDTDTDTDTDVGSAAAP